MSDKTPMERDYPTICEWTRHGAVFTDALERELRTALEWVSDKRVVLLPKRGIGEIKDRPVCPTCGNNDPALIRTEFVTVTVVSGGTKTQLPVSRVCLVCHSEDRP